MLRDKGAAVEPFVDLSRELAAACPLEGLVRMATIRATQTGD